MKTIVVRVEFKPEQRGLITCERTSRDWWKCPDSQIGEACVQMACSCLGSDAINYFDQIEFQIEDLRGFGFAVGRMLEGRGYKVVDLRKVGMVPSKEERSYPAWVDRALADDPFIPAINVYSVSPTGALEIKSAGLEPETDEPILLEPADVRDDSGHTASGHEWMVYSTALADVVLMVRCRVCDTRGIVKDPNTAEWNKAFRAPTNPYPWEDKSRVTTR